MVYLILAGLVLVLIVAVNVAKAEPMPEDMQDEDEQQSHLDVRWWEVRATYQPRALSDRMEARRVLQAKVYPFPKRRA